MTGLDEMLRSVLADDAETQAPPLDLAGLSMRRGRRLRLRRRAGFVGVSALGVAAIVGGSVAVASQTAGHGGTQHVVPAAHGGSSPTGNERVIAPPSRPWWRTWQAGRTWGQPAPSSFLTGLAPGHHVAVYASGQMDDGTEFALYIDSTQEPHIAQWMEDWRTTPNNFGETTQRPAPRAKYLAFESPTHSVTGQTQFSQWLIVAGRPGTVSASYSADGTTWQAMTVEHGLAVLRLPRHAPRNARLRLADASGTYYDGVLVTD